MGYNHYPYARLVGGHLQIKDPTKSYPLIEMQSTGAIVLRGLSGAVGKVYLTQGTDHVFSAYNDTDSVLDSVTGNKNIFLKPNGSGLLKFGAQSAIAAETATHYINALDAAGAAIKIALVS